MSSSHCGHTCSIFCHCSGTSSLPSLLEFLKYHSRQQLVQVCALQAPQRRGGGLASGTAGIYLGLGLVWNKKGLFHTFSTLELTRLSIVTNTSVKGSGLPRWVHFAVSFFPLKSLFFPFHVFPLVFLSSRLFPLKIWMAHPCQPQQKGGNTIASTNKVMKNLQVWEEIMKLDQRWPAWQHIPIPLFRESPHLDLGISWASCIAVHVRTGTSLSYLTPALELVKWLLCITSGETSALQATRVLLPALGWMSELLPSRPEGGEFTFIFPGSSLERLSEAIPK